MLIHLFLFSRVFYVFEAYAFTVIDCLMNQIYGIVECSAVAFHSAVYIQVPVQLGCLVRTCHTAELSDKPAALRSRDKAR